MELNFDRGGGGGVGVGGGGALVTRFEGVLSVSYKFHTI